MQTPGQGMPGYQGTLGPPTARGALWPALEMGWLSKLGGRAPHGEAGTLSCSGTGWDRHCLRRHDMLCCLSAQTCARWTSSRRWSPLAGWPVA